MAQSTWLSDFERDCIRLGVIQGRKAREIMEALNRSKQCIYREITKMKEDGSIDELRLELEAGHDG